MGHKELTKLAGGIRTRGIRNFLADLGHKDLGHKDLAHLGHKDLGHKDFFRRGIRIRGIRTTSEGHRGIRTGLRPGI